jgi:tRNA(Ile)-lysidine synthase TilS/MesJ
MDKDYELLLEKFFEDELNPTVNDYQRNYLRDTI